ncbi:hypothetical protein WAI92_20790, partial [Acinetobacter baumannii]
DAAITALNSRYANDKQAIDRKTAKLQSDFEIHQQELEAQKKAINTSNLSAEAEELRKKINTLSAELQILKRGADLEQQIYRLEGRRDSLD